MRRRLDSDLGRWERGELSLEELEARHPNRPVREIVSLHNYLTSLRTEPTPSPSNGLSFLTGLPSGHGPRRELRARLQRPMVVAAAVTLLTAGLAFGLEPVRRGAAKLFRDAVRRVAEGELPGVAFVPRPSRPPLVRTVRIIGEEDRPQGWRPSAQARDGETVSCLIVDGPTHGRATLTSNCSAGSYLPDRDFSGTDTFRYAVRGEEGVSAAAPVEVTVIPVNDPPLAQDDTASTDEDVPVVVSVVANDPDPDGDSRPPTRGDLHQDPSPSDLVIRSISGALGTVDIAGRRLVYAPSPNFFGTDDFRYTVWDGNDGLDTGSVSVSVTPVNDPPVMRELVVAGQEDTTSVWRPRVEDVDGDVLSCSIVEPPGHGQATVSPDCSEGTYAPDPDRHGSDALVVRISDGDLSVDGKVSLDVLAVNDRPTVEDLAVVTDEDAPVIWSPKVEDVDGDELTCSLVEPPVHGQATVSPDCSSGTYVPDPNLNGDDGFAYTVSDGTAKAEAPGNVTLTIRPMNDPPVAVPDAATTDQGVSVVIPVLVNDRDVEAHPLTLHAVAAPVFGSATANGDGTITYTPNLDFLGTDGFTYTIIDPEGGTTTGQVIVTVIPSPAPTARSAGQSSDSVGGLSSGQKRP
jgi:hypothetical protein